MADAIDLSAINRVRAAMGMKPIPDAGAGASGPVFQDTKNVEEEEPASTLETREAAAYDNFNKLQQDAQAKAKAQARKDAIKRERDRAQQKVKLEGKSLGEADDTTGMDTKSWLLGQKKRQSKIEKQRKKLEQLYAEQEAQAEYTAADLAGVKVGHQLNQFDDGGEQILTLKDAAIGEDDDEDDELENLDLREREELDKRLELKKRKPVYDPNAIDEEGEKSILAHYDEEIDGKKRNKFTLDGHGSTTEKSTLAAEDENKRKGITINLDILTEDVPISDYVDPSSIKFKKPKKSKKSKTTRKRTVDDDAIYPVMEETASSMDTGAMEVDATSAAIGKKRSFDNLLEDDEDLQAQLAKSRREALKKRKKVRPADIARQIRMEALEALETPDVAETTENPDEEPGMIIDETSAFLANLQKAVVPDRQRKKSKSAQPASPDQDGDVSMQESYANVKDEEEVKQAIERAKSSAPHMTATGLEEEKTLNQGIGATLGMLKERGLIKTDGNGDSNAAYRNQKHFLAEKHKREAETERKARAQRERDRVSGRLAHMSMREREEYARQTNANRDQAEARQIANLFDQEYKPSVQLKYIDEYGRSMNAKEAFKELSHQFHGKGSGKQKTEKKLKKIEDEKKREAMSALDSSQSTGMSNAMGDRSKKSRQAGVRLQ